MGANTLKIVLGKPVTACIICISPVEGLANFWSSQTRHGANSFCLPCRHRSRATRRWSTPTPWTDQRSRTLRPEICLTRTQRGEQIPPSTSSPSHPFRHSMALVSMCTIYSLSLHVILSSALAQRERCPIPCCLLQPEGPCVFCSA